MKIVTHNGSYHADDVFTVGTLLIMHPDAEIIRSRDDAVINSGDVVVDVGGVYDPSAKRFDHHQPEGAGKRDNGIPFASFGLIWKEYGESIAGSKEVAQLIDEKLVQPIDADDNGVKISEKIYENISEYTISDYLNSFYQGEETLEELDKIFENIVKTARDIVVREVFQSKEKVADWEQVRKIYEESEDKQIIVFPRHMSWKRVLIPTEAVYVVSETQNKSWQASAVPKELGSFELKKPFPENWAGKSGQELIEASGVKDATFAHRARFLVGAETKEGAIRLAKISLESQSTNNPNATNGNE